MYLNIISLKGIEFEGEVVSLNLKTTSGEITVLDNHRPLLTVLSQGKVIITKKDNNKLNLDIRSGFLEVNDKNEATVLMS